MKKFSLFLSLLVTLSFAAVAKAQAPLSYRVDTIDALLNITTYGSDAKLIAYVGGGTARDDGLGGLFFFDGTSSAATNVYAIYRPKTIAAANPGRWFKLPTQVANRQTDVTVANEDTYAWKLLDSNAANAFSVGLTSANVYLQTWGSRPLYINSSLGGNNTILNSTGGNVGIGDTNPGSKLDVAGNLNADGTITRSHAQGTDGYIVVQTTGKSNTVMGYNDTGGDVQGVATATSYFGNLNAYDTAITEGTITIATFKATSGNVGIGSTAPLAKLSVNGGVHVGGDSDPGDNNLAVDGTSTLTGTVAIGGGTPIVKVLSAAIALDFGSTATLTSTDLTMTVTGALVGDSVSLGLPAAPDANACFTAWVSAADTVTVRFNNYSAGPIDPASATYRATVTQF